MLDAGGHARLLDFGIAAPAEGAEGGEVDLSVEDGTALLRPVARRTTTLKDLVAEMKRLDDPYRLWDQLDQP